MTRRERVLKTLNFETPDQLPKDLGGMRSTGISAFAYPKLVNALGLPERRPRVHDTHQMLALPDEDVLDALDCDVVALDSGTTNAYPQPERWQPYDFGGRLPALVQNRDDYQELPDGSIRQRPDLLMVRDSYVFDAAHGGHPVDLSGDLPKPDLDQVCDEVTAGRPTDDAIRELAEVCRRTRAATDRAVFISCPLNANLHICGPGGLAVFPVLCILEPDSVHRYHERLTAMAIDTARRLLPAIAPCVDIIMLDSDDWGTQNATIASPDVYRELFRPYERRVTDECHRLAPDVKLFLHTCGAVYEILDDIIDSGYDILNPVQWPAGGHSYREWKDKARGRIALWGGGVNAQATLASGSVADAEREVAEVVGYLKQDNGYVFNNIHNLLADVPPEKIIAIYRAAGRTC